MPQSHKRYSSCAAVKSGTPDGISLSSGFRAAARIDEELSPYLPPSKRLYVFGALAPQAARFVMWLLPELKACLVPRTLHRLSIRSGCSLNATKTPATRSNMMLCSAQAMRFIKRT